jgi:hypothetical protein
MHSGLDQSLGTVAGGPYFSSVIIVDPAKAAVRQCLRLFIRGAAMAAFEPAV